jgi:hypothetical protein
LGQQRLPKFIIGRWLLNKSFLLNLKLILKTIMEKIIYLNLHSTVKREPLRMVVLEVADKPFCPICLTPAAHKTSQLLLVCKKCQSQLLKNDTNKI